MPTVTRQTLLIDADDTLWENNIYFERAIAAFTAWLSSQIGQLTSQLNHETQSPETIRQHINACEHATIAQHGYGLRSFRQSLANCYSQLTGSPITESGHSHILHLTSIIQEHPIDLLTGVAETLPVLASRHRLMLVTKGNPAEQLDKLHRSGLAPHFSGVEVLPEKHQQAYRALAAHHQCDHASTWMIGNSPKSDINPALAAGLNAVFLPHQHTWQLEHEELDPIPHGQTLLELPTFAHLTHHF